MKPPASFLQAMEEYVREAPRASTARKDLVCKLILYLDMSSDWAYIGITIVVMLVC